MTPKEPTDLDTLADYAEGYAEFAMKNSGRVPPTMLAISPEGLAKDRAHNEPVIDAEHRVLLRLLAAAAERRLLPARLRQRLRELLLRRVPRVARLERIEERVRLDRVFRHRGIQLERHMVIVLGVVDDALEMQGDFEAAAVMSEAEQSQDGTCFWKISSESL